MGVGNMVGGGGSGRHTRDIILSFISFINVDKRVSVTFALITTLQPVLNDTDCQDSAVSTVTHCGLNCPGI